MGLTEMASGNSLWRGFEYYEKEKVLSWKKDGDFAYSGSVAGSGTEPYTVYIDTEHPRKSHCNCPHADGRRVICKHMIALYFTAEPEAAKEFLRKVEEWEAEEEEEEQRHYEELVEYVNGLSEGELRAKLLDALLELDERRYY